VLAYHLVESRFDIGFTRITPRQFERQMQWLSERGYRGAPVREYLQPAGNVNEADKRIGISFDDGYASLLEHVAPIMRQHGFRGSIFVITDYVGKENRWDVNLLWRRFGHLSWPELRALAEAGWEIGSHSCTHAYLSHLDDARLWREVWESRVEIEQRIGAPAESFCLPYGRGDQRVFQTVAKAGYHAILALGQSFQTSTGCTLVARRGVYRFDRLKAFRKKILTPHDDRWQTFRQRVISSFSTGSVVVKKVFPAKQHLPEAPAPAKR
jgi:peptidoglycan/xylan/chitin deacetylase (PgdA/CDA1 family)